MRFFTLSHILILISLIIIACSTASAAAVTRKLSSEVIGDYEYFIRSANPATTSSLLFEFAVTGFPRWRLTYYNRTGDTTPGLTFRTGLVKIVEYNETINEADSTSSLSLIGNGSKWSSVTAVDLSINPTIAAKAISTMFTAANNITNVTLTSYIASSSNAAIDAIGFPAGLDPSSVKYSVRIDGFPYQYVNSSLALVTIVQSVSPIAVFNATCLDIGGENNRAGLSWSSSVSAATEIAIGAPTYTAEIAAVPAVLNESILRADDDKQTIAAAADYDTDIRKDSETLKVIWYKINNANVNNAVSVVWDPQLAMSTGTLDVESGAAAGNAASSQRVPPPSKWLLGLCMVFVTFMAML